jgi:hypothetical protein
MSQEEEEGEEEQQQVQQQQPQQMQQDDLLSQQQTQGEGTTVDEPRRRYSIAAVLRSIKVEPGTSIDPAAAAAAGGDGTREYWHTAVQQPLAAAGATEGPQALRLLQEAKEAGFLYLPNEQQMDYFLLADQPYDDAQLQELDTAQLAPQLATRSIGRINRSGAIREAVMTVPMGKSHVQHVYPALAPGFENLIAALPEQQRQLLLQQQQQQQQPTQKKRKLNDSSSTSAAAAACDPTDAAMLLLQALRRLVR